MLIVVILGLPGSGKTTACRLLQERWPIRYISIDNLWQELFDKPKFTSMESQQTFASFKFVVRSALSTGTPLLAEGVFASHKRLSDLEEIARAQSTPISAIGLYCEQNLALERIQMRARDEDWPPITEDKWLKLKAKQDAWRTNRAEIQWIDTTNLQPKKVLRQLERELWPALSNLCCNFP